MLFIYLSLRLLNIRLSYFSQRSCQIRLIIEVTVRSSINIIDCILIITLHFKIFLSRAPFYSTSVDLIVLSTQFFFTLLAVRLNLAGIGLFSRGSAITINCKSRLKLPSLIVILLLVFLFYINFHFPPFYWVCTVAYSFRELLHTHMNTIDNSHTDKTKNGTTMRRNKPIISDKLDIVMNATIPQFFLIW